MYGGEHHVAENCTIERVTGLGAAVLGCMKAVANATSVVTGLELDRVSENPRYGEYEAL